MITEYFSNLTSVIQADYAAGGKSLPHSQLLQKLSERFLGPLLPSSVRHGPGFVLDMLERQAGPFDFIAVSDSWPAIGQGEANFYLADGVIFCLSARNWATQDLTEFAAKAKDVKMLTRKATAVIPCIAFSYTPLETSEVMDFMKSSAGASVDAIFSLGKNFVVRNSLGWYGDPHKVPFVSEPIAGAAMKFFAFYLLQAVQVAAGLPFGLADYQHL